MLDVNPDNEITYNNTIKVSSVVKWATFFELKDDFYEKPSLFFAFQL